MTNQQKKEAFRLAESALNSPNPIEEIAAIVTPEIINFSVRDGRTLLMSSIVKDNLALTQELIHLGADVNLQDKQGWTALHFAAQFYLPQHVLMLLEHGAQLDLQDVYGNSPLWRAAFESKGRGEIIAILLSKGANPHLKNYYGNSAYDLAHIISNYNVKQFFT